MSTHAFDPDPLEDMCPICGEFITDDQEWTRLPSGQIAHLECDQPSLDISKSE